MNNSKFVGIIVLILLVPFLFQVVITGSLIWSTSTQSDFNEGSYVGTYYNNTLNAVVLNSSKLNGSYLSKVFDVGDNVLENQWNNVSFDVDLTSDYGKELLDYQAVDSDFNMSDNVLLYHMNNDSVLEGTGVFYDFSGNGNNGSCTNCPTLVYPGKINKAYDFDGTPVQTDLFVNQSGIYNYTFEMWLYRTSGFNIDFLFKTQNYSYDWSVYVKASNSRFRIGTGSSYVESVVTSDLNKWQHFAFVFVPGENLKIYKNGINYTGPLISTTLHPIKLILGEGFRGKIDEFAVYNRTLSSEEIKKHYDLGIAKLNLSVRDCDDSLCSGDSWVDVADESPVDFTLNGNRYFQYKFDLFSNFTNTSPKLKSVVVDYSTPRVKISNCSLLNSDNTIYELNESFNTSNSTCFTITGNNVTLDGKGYTVTGDGTNHGVSYSGVTIAKEIKNLKLNNFRIGIFNDVVNSLNISNCVFTNNSNQGVYLRYASDNYLVNNTFVNNSNGIYLYDGSDNNYILNNTFKNSDFVMSRSDDDLIQYNSFENSLIEFGLYCDNSNLVDNYFDGLKLKDRAIVIDGQFVHDLNLKNNTLANFDYGFYVYNNVANAYNLTINDTSCINISSACYYQPFDEAQNEDIFINNITFDNVDVGFKLPYVSGTFIIENTDFNGVNKNFDISSNNYNLTLINVDSPKGIYVFNSYGSLNISNAIHFNNVDLGSDVSISQDLIKVNSNSINQTAKLAFKNVSVVSPKPTVAFDDLNFESCEEDICYNSSFDGDEFSFNVRHFTSFSYAGLGINVNQPFDGKTYAESNITLDVDVSGSYDKIWYNDGLTNITFDGITTVNLSEGSYTYIFYVNDSSNNIVQKTVSFDVDYSFVNSAPVINSVQIVPIHPYVSDDIFCRVVANDNDDSQVYVNFTWYRNGNKFEEERKNCYTGVDCDSSYFSNPNHFDNLTCEVFADDLVNSSAVFNITKIVDNHPPSVPRITMNQPQDNLPIYCNITQESFDADYDEFIYNYTIFKNDVFFKYVETRNKSIEISVIEHLNGGNWTCQVYATDYFNKSDIQKYGVKFGNNPATFSASDNVPVSGIPGARTINITTIASDPDGDKINFFVCDSNDANEFGCVGNELCSVMNITINPSCVFNAKSMIGNYNWYAFVYDEYNLPSSSNVQSGSYYVNETVNMTPLGNEIYNYTVPMRWSSKSDADTYEVLFSYNYGSTWNGYAQTYTHLNYTKNNYYNYDVSNLPGGNIYRVKIRYNDSSNIWHDYLESDNFYIVHSIKNFDIRLFRNREYINRNVSLLGMLELDGTNFTESWNGWYSAEYPKNVDYAVYIDGTKYWATNSSDRIETLTTTNTGMVPNTFSDLTFYDYQSHLHDQTFESVFQVSNYGIHNITVVFNLSSQIYLNKTVQLNISHNTAPVHNTAKFYSNDAEKYQRSKISNEPEFLGTQSNFSFVYGKNASIDLDTYFYDYEDDDKINFSFSGSGFTLDDNNTLSYNSVEGAVNNTPGNFVQENIFNPVFTNRIRIKVNKARQNNLSINELEFFNTKFYSNATYESKVFDLNGVSNVSRIMLVANDMEQYLNASLGLSLDDVNWTYYSLNNDTFLNKFARYIKLKVNLSTTNENVSPVLWNVFVAYKNATNSSRYLPLILDDSYSGTAVVNDQIIMLPENNSNSVDMTINGEVYSSSVENDLNYAIDDDFNTALITKHGVGDWVYVKFNDTFIDKIKFYEKIKTIQNYSLDYYDLLHQKWVNILSRNINVINKTVKSVSVRAEDYLNNALANQTNLNFVFAECSIDSDCVNNNPSKYSAICYNQSCIYQPRVIEPYDKKYSETGSTVQVINSDKLKVDVLNKGTVSTNRLVYRIFDYNNSKLIKESVFADSFGYNLTDFDMFESNTSEYYNISGDWNYELGYLSSANYGFNELNINRTINNYVIYSDLLADLSDNGYVGIVVNDDVNYVYGFALKNNDEVEYGGNNLIRFTYNKSSDNFVENEVYKKGLQPYKRQMLVSNDGTNVKLYLDGVLYATENVNEFGSGSKIGLFSYNTFGKFDTLAVYNYDSNVIQTYVDGVNALRDNSVNYSVKIDTSKLQGINNNLYLQIDNVRQRNALTKFNLTYSGYSSTYSSQFVGYVVGGAIIYAAAGVIGQYGPQIACWWFGCTEPPKDLPCIDNNCNLTFAYYDIHNWPSWHIYYPDDWTIPNVFPGISYYVQKPPLNDHRFYDCRPFGIVVPPSVDEDCFSTKDDVFVKSSGGESPSQPSTPPSTTSSDGCKHQTSYCDVNSKKTSFEKLGTSCYKITKNCVATACGGSEWVTKYDLVDCSGLGFGVPDKKENGGKIEDKDSCSSKTCPEPSTIISEDGNYCVDLKYTFEGDSCVSSQSKVYYCGPEKEKPKGDIEDGLGYPPTSPPVPPTYDGQPSPPADGLGYPANNDDLFDFKIPEILTKTYDKFKNILPVIDNLFSTKDDVPTDDGLGNDRGSDKIIPKGDIPNSGVGGLGGGSLGSSKSVPKGDIPTDGGLGNDRGSDKIIPEGDVPIDDGLSNPNLQTPSPVLPINTIVGSIKNVVKTVGDTFNNVLDSIKAPVVDNGLINQIKSKSNVIDSFTVYEEGNLNNTLGNIKVVNDAYYGSNGLLVKNYGGWTGNLPDIDSKYFSFMFKGNITKVIITLDGVDKEMIVNDSYYIGDWNYFETKFVEKGQVEKFEIYGNGVVDSVGFVKMWNNKPVELKLKSKDNYKKLLFCEGKRCNPFNVFNKLINLDCENCDKVVSYDLVDNNDYKSDKKISKLIKFDKQSPVVKDDVDVNNKGSLKKLNLIVSDNGVLKILKYCVDEVCYDYNNTVDIICLYNSNCNKNISYVVEDFAGNKVEKKYSVKSVNIDVSKFNGETTNFTSIISEIPEFNLTLEKKGLGKIKFKNKIRFDGDYDINSKVNISKNLVTIKNSTLLNKSARIYLNVSFENPKVTWDPEDNGTFVDCPVDACANVSFNDDLLSFDVKHFTSYSSRESTTPTLLFNYSRYDDLIYDENDTYKFIVNWSSIVGVKDVLIYINGINYEAQYDGKYFVEVKDLKPGEIDWYSTAISNLGDIATSPVWNFVIEKQPVELNVLINGEQNNAVVLVGTNVTINASTNPGDALVYLDDELVGNGSDLNLLVKPDLGLMNVTVKNLGDELYLPKSINYFVNVTNLISEPVLIVKNVSEKGVEVGSSDIKRISSSGGSGGSFRVADPVESSFTNFDSLIAVEPLNNISNMTIDFGYICAGPDFNLYKCQNWNWTTQKCYGSWKDIGDVPQGFYEYNVTLPAEDPGLGIGPIPPSLTCGDGQCTYYEDVENCPQDCEGFRKVSIKDYFVKIYNYFTGNTVVDVCQEEWVCDAWSAWSSNGSRIRECRDLNGCGENKPAEIQTCNFVETCEDGIQNQDETGIDCGGVCGECGVKEEPKSLWWIPLFLLIVGVLAWKGRGGEELDDLFCGVTDLCDEAMYGISTSGKSIKNIVGKSFKSVAFFVNNKKLNYKKQKRINAIKKSYVVKKKEKLKLRKEIFNAKRDVVRNKELKLKKVAIKRNVEKYSKRLFGLSLMPGYLLGRIMKKLVDYFKSVIDNFKDWWFLKKREIKRNKLTKLKLKELIKKKKEKDRQKFAHKQKIEQNRIRKEKYLLKFQKEVEAAAKEALSEKKKVVVKKYAKKSAKELFAGFVSPGVLLGIGMKKLIGSVKDIFELIKVYYSIKPMKKVPKFKKIPKIVHKMKVPKFVKKIPKNKKNLVFKNLRKDLGKVWFSAISSFNGVFDLFDYFKKQYLKNKKIRAIKKEKVRKQKNSLKLQKLELKRKNELAEQVLRDLKLKARSKKKVEFKNKVVKYEHNFKKVILEGVFSVPTFLGLGMKKMVNYFNNLLKSFRKRFNSVVIDLLYHRLYSRIEDAINKGYTQKEIIEAFKEKNWNLKLVKWCYKIVKRNLK